MSDESRLADLLLIWEERFDQGEDVLAELLCGDCPELAGALAQQIAKLKKSMWVTHRIETNHAELEHSQIAPLPSGVDHPVIANQYRLDHFIAEGGFGQVWRGFDLVLERPVAVKVPRPNRLADADRIGRFLAEARRVARLRHPNIVPVYNVVRHKGVYFIILELIEGKDLRQRMKMGRLPMREIVRIVLEVADAVEYAHQQGVIHRDIKPANILLDETGSVFITDFGIASSVESELGSEICGTLPYMSPEQRSGARCDARSDVFSLGAVLFQLLTGDSPSPSLTPRTQFNAELPWNEYSVDNLEPPLHHFYFAGNQTVSNTPLGMPPALSDICSKCLAVNPKDRFATVLEMAHVLRSAVSGIVSEDDWMTCTDPSRLYAHLTNLLASRRKMRLLACACVGPDVYTLGERSRNAIIVAEKFADGLATSAELRIAANGAWEATDSSLADAFFGAASCADQDCFRAASNTFRYISSAFQCHAIHDLFGPTLFRSPVIDPKWLSWEDRSVLRLATTIYDRKAFQKMPELADLLERAGCNDYGILTHCRAKAWHFKGCWVLDLILGKNE